VINTYLLEKSRVVQPEEGERNYHVFYQLLGQAAKDAELRAKYDLGPPETFFYLNQSSVKTIQGVCEASEFSKLIDALQVFGVDQETMDQIWQTVSSILHLGNIKFDHIHVQNAQTNQDGSKIANPGELELAAKHLGLAVDCLEKALLFHSYGTRSVVYIPYKPSEAAQARDAFAKSLYAGLFNYLGQRINETLKRPGCNPSNKTIGVLDIFGFEILQTNSFEQLCINFCNERLQSHFNEECFRIEQEEYRAEGVEVEEIGYNDNQPCLDMLEKKPSGLFAMIEEEINVPGGSDLNWLQKIYQTHAASDYLAKPSPKDGRDCFKILHYAGDVVYRVEGLLDKSKDALHHDLDVLMDPGASNKKFLTVLKQARIIGPLKDRGGNEDGSAGKKKKSQPTLGMQFCGQLRTLMKKLFQTKPHFIKCLKPNMEKKGGLFIAEEILTQLQYTGIVGLCKIRQIGYPERMPLDEFFDRYKALDFSKRSPEELIMKMAEMCIMKPGLWVLGHTKLLMKHEQHNYVSDALSKVQLKAALMVQRCMRGWWQRRWFQRMRSIRDFIRQAIVARIKDLLTEGLEMMDMEMPMKGDHLPEKVAARKLVARLVDEEKAEAMLASAMETKDMAQLKAAMAYAQEMQYASAALEAAQELLKKMEQELHIRNQLTQAISARTIDALQAAVAMATEANMEETAEVKQAKTILHRLEKEAELKAQYERAVAAGSREEIDRVLTQMAEAGVPLPADARDNLAALEAQTKHHQSVADTKHKLQTATAANDLAAVQEVMLEAHAAGINTEDDTVQVANQYLKGVDQKKADMGALMAACRTLEVKMCSTGGIDRAELEVVHKCITALVGYEFSQEENSQINEAQKILRKGMAVQQCTDGLRKALNERNYEDLSAMHQKAEELEVKCQIVEDVAKMIKEMESQTPEIPMGTMEQILEIARATRWQYHKYSRLRTREQFAKGKYLNRRKTIDGMFFFSKDIIPNSMIDLPTQTNKIAVNINKCLLAFCGTRRTTYPASSAQALMEKGKAISSLRDEVFVQICKHLSQNPDRKSMQRGWILLCLCIELFSPSVEFELFLLNFMVKHSNDELWADYANFCLQRLEEELDLDEEALATNVRQKQVPSIDYITAVINGEITIFDKYRNAGKVAIKPRV